jgi:hypothetical protein
MEEKKLLRPMMALWKHIAQSGKSYLNGWLDIEFTADEIEEIKRSKHIRIQAVGFKANKYSDSSPTLRIFVSEKNQPTNQVESGDEEYF